MGKPSIFSHDYKERVKKRRINTFLFVLLVICIAFFGGKYYLNKQDVSTINGSKNSGILNKLSNFNLWSQIKEKFTKAETPVLKPTPSKSVVVPIVPVKPVVTQSATPTLKTTYEYTYLTKAGKKIIVEYKRQGSKILFVGLKDISNNSDFDISKEKNSIVFDIKNESSIIICDSLGKFKVISRSDYKTSKTHKTFSKEAVMAKYKNYIWAEKPHFTHDGRVTYISRLPYIRVDNSLFLWTVKLDGTGYKNIAKLTNDINKISYGGFDTTDRLIVKVATTQFYLGKDSYTLKK